jgi:CDP-diacylglycerol--glycerol-3-phosphate 3-phosphatidyltransferase
MRLTIPNQLTLLRIILTPIFIYLILQDSIVKQFYASVIFTFASLTDWYDGWYARKFGVITRLGQFMDPLADKILVTSALIVFAILDYAIAWMVWVIAIRDAVITMNRIFALQVGKPIITHELAKWKTMLQMVTIFLILIYMNVRNYFWHDLGPYKAQYFDVIGISMLLVTLLTVLSGVFYMIENKELLLNMMRKIMRL